MSTVQPPAASYDGMLRRLDAARPHVTVCPRCRPRGLQWVAVGLPCSSGMPLSNHPGGDLRSFGHHQQFQSWKFVVREECRIGISSPSRDGIVGLCSPAQCAESQQQRCMGAGED